MPHAPQHLACWFEIPVTDLDRSMAFYASVLDVEMRLDTESGPNPMAFFPAPDPLGSISGHLYPGKPSREGNTIHLVAPQGLDAARARIVAAGGEVESPDIAVPAGRFFYARDPDGNSIGLFNLGA